MKFSILFLYSVVLLGKAGQPQLVGQQDSVQPKMVAGVKADGMVRALQRFPACQSLGEAADACVLPKLGCFDCIEKEIAKPDVTCEAVENYLCLGAGGCQECAGCELLLEAYFRCQLPFKVSGCPRLDCNFGIVPFFGELPFIGQIFNLLFGWLVNIFN